MHYVKNAFAWPALTNDHISYSIYPKTKTTTTTTTELSLLEHSIWSNSRKRERDLILRHVLAWYAMTATRSRGAGLQTCNSVMTFWVQDIYHKPLMKIRKAWREILLRALINWPAERKTWNFKSHCRSIGELGLFSRNSWSIEFGRGGPKFFILYILIRYRRCNLHPANME